MTASQAASTDPDAEAAASEVLAAGGSGVDAIIGGFLGAAAAREAVLLGSLVALVGGVGVGARLIDGRPCQPGRGVRRPRGYREAEAIPDAALAAAPRSLGALALLHAYGAVKPMGALARPAAALARQRGARERAKVLDAVGRSGAAALGGLAHALLRAAGSGAGGLLGEDDLALAPGDEAARFAPVAAAALELAVPPWAAPRGPSAAPSGLRVDVLVAADGRGLVAAIAFGRDDEGPALPEHELRLGRYAEPVRRGVPRVTPGTPCAAEAPIALLRRSHAGWYAALGVADRAPLDPARLLGDDDSLAALLARLADGRAGCAVSVQRGRTKVTRV
jgi:gamma-glutamyltranspeptidase/glutathione hydrolase